MRFYQDYEIWRKEEFFTLNLTVVKKRKIKEKPNEEEKGYLFYLISYFYFSKLL